MAEDNSSHTKPSQMLLRDRLAAILSQHPEFSSGDNAGQPLITARAIGKVFDAYSTSYGIAILPAEPRQQLEDVVSLADNDITLDQIVSFIVDFTSASPHTSPTPPQNGFVSPEQSFTLEAEAEYDERGREEERSAHGSQSRSSSNDSVVTSYYRPDQRRQSRNPSMSNGSQSLNTPPMTPSPFDSSTRQRSNPLGNAPPSAFKPQAPYRRRKSDGGNSDGDLSDTDRRVRSKRRTPSSSTNPSPSVTSPSPDLPTYPRPESPSGSRAFGKTHSLPSLGGNFVFPSTRPNRRTPPKQASLPPEPELSSPERVEHELDMSNSSFGSDSAIASLLASHPHMVRDDDAASVSSSDIETASMKDMMIRSVVSSNASLSTPEDRLEALQRNNAELNRKLKEQDKAFLGGLSEREQEIEDLQTRVDELKAELAASRKEEKDLKQKERMTGMQLSNFEQEIAKLQRQLETSKANYQTMMKQYNEQLVESEKCRNQLRERDSRIKYGEQALAERVKELHKTQAEKEILENANETLTEDLESMRQAQQELEEQKHENLLLKETIDRLRYDMDQLRIEASGNQGSIRGLHSVPGTMSKSLANELRATLADASEAGERDVEEPLKVDVSVMTDNMEDDRNQEDEDEDYVETIVTTSRRRKVGPRASSASVVFIDEEKEYIDAYTQHDPSTVAQYSSAAECQTDPLPDPPHPPMKVEMNIQTIPEPISLPRITVATEVQTDGPSEPELKNAKAGPSKPTIKEEDGLSDSTSATTASTSSFPLDSPPSYEALAADERHKLLQKWHPGLHGVVSGGVRGGISSNVLLEWSNIKREIGFECVAIEKTIQASVINGERSGLAKIEAEVDDDSEEEIARSGRRGARKFYNIYNTYVLGNGASSDPSGRGTGRGRDALLLGIGAGAVAVLAGVAALAMGPEDPRNLANTFLGTRIDGPHGRLGPMDTSDAFWLLVEKIFRTGLNAARRVPPYTPT